MKLVTILKEYMDKNLAWTPQELQQVKNYVSKYVKDPETQEVDPHGVQVGNGLLAKLNSPDFNFTKISNTPDQNSEAAFLRDIGLTVNFPTAWTKFEKWLGYNQR
jgi:hypothetical protein